MSPSEACFSLKNSRNSLLLLLLDAETFPIRLRPPPRSPVQIRFPAVSVKTPCVPRLSRGPGRRFRSLRRVTAERACKMPPGLWHAKTLSRQILPPRTETGSNVD